TSPLRHSRGAGRARARSHQRRIERTEPKGALRFPLIKVVPIHRQMRSPLAPTVSKRNAALILAGGTVSTGPMRIGGCRSDGGPRPYSRAGAGSLRSHDGGYLALWLTLAEPTQPPGRRAPAPRRGFCRPASFRPSG